MSLYVTPTELAQHLNMRSPIETAQNDMLVRAIEAASAQIEGVCGRTFNASPELRYFTALTSTAVEIGYPSQMQAVDLDSLGDYTYGTPLLPSEYFLSDTRGKRYLQLNSTAVNTLPLHLNGIQILARFGEAAVPADVKMATMLQAARLWKRKDAVFGEIQNEIGYMRIRDSFDLDARQLLKDGGWIAPRKLVIS